MNQVEERDTLENIVRAWDTYERATNNLHIIDYDLNPQPSPIEFSTRDDVIFMMHNMNATATNPYVRANLTAHLAYLGELHLREQNLPPMLSFRKYLTSTQGGPILVPTVTQLAHVQEETRHALSLIGVPWGLDLPHALTEAEEALPAEGLVPTILAWKDYFESDIRAITGSTADFTLATEFVNTDDYWGYWVGGEADDILLRINEKYSRHFSSTHAASMAAHELLGHGLQLTSWRKNALANPSIYLHPRYSTLHTGEQTLLEGIAQTWPLFLPSAGPVLRAYTLLTCYVAIAWMDAHILINSPNPDFNKVADMMQPRLPWWTRERILERMTYHTDNPSHKSYLWAYGVGARYFLNLTRTPDPANVLREVYQRPYSYEEMLAFFPSS